MNRFGWIPDRRDERDYSFTAKVKMRKLPKKASVKELCPPVYNQLETSSCVAQSIAADLAAVHVKQGLASPEPSRLFIYYGARELEGSVTVDAGCTIRDGIKTVVKLGTCTETDWPFNPEMVFTKPYPQCYENALKEIIISYHRIGYNLRDMKTCVCEGYPFIFGISVFENFPMQAGTGIVPPPRGEEIGGHAMLAVGYDDSFNSFIIRNSWGEVWGNLGYGMISYSYLMDMTLAGDFWTIRMVQ
jgi:C1A family cysteine protease